MNVPYLQNGRTNQKTRTRDALIDAARRLLVRGSTSPTVEEAAAEAAISRTTAYRYFPNRQALLLAVYPHIEQQSLLGPNPPTDPMARLEIFAEDLTRRLVEHEPEYRAALQLALERGSAAGEKPLLRQGRRIVWIEDALAPLRGRLPELEFRQVVFGIGATLGIEALIWLTDMAGLSREEAVEIMRSNARTLLRSALEGLK